MRKTLGVCLLVLLLTGPAFAGEMPNDVPAPPPPQPISAPQEPTDADQTATLDVIMGNDVSDILTETALDLLALLPSLL